MRIEQGVSPACAQHGRHVLVHIDTKSFLGHAGQILNFELSQREHMLLTVNSVFLPRKCWCIFLLGKTIEANAVAVLSNPTSRDRDGSQQSWIDAF